MARGKEQESAQRARLRERAYRAMYCAEQKHGHGSPAHRIAWTAYVEASDDFPANARHAFNGNADMSTALDLVEASCRKGGGSADVKAAIKEIAARRNMI